MIINTQLWIYWKSVLVWVYNNFRKNMTSKQRAYKEWRNKRPISKERCTLEVRKYMDTMGLTKCQAESDFIKELK